MVENSGGGVSCVCGESFNVGDYRVREGEEVPAGSCGTFCDTG